MTPRDKTTSGKYQDIIIEGHDADGILEYDNPMPGWWVYLFWATAIFALGYASWYLPGYGPTKEAEYESARVAYEKEFKKAESDSNSPDFPALKDLQIYAANEEKIKLGSVLFQTRCVACHAAEGQGLIGPNLTDDYWIHGGGLDNIYNTIKFGVLDKGMLAWKDQLSVEEMMQVTSFVRSIQGTNKAGKEPQGEISPPTSLE